MKHRLMFATAALLFLVAGCRPLKNNNKSDKFSTRSLSKIPEDANHGADTTVVDFSDITELKGSGTWTNRYWINIAGGQATADKSFIVKKAGLSSIDIPQFEPKDLGVGGEALTREEAARQLLEGLATRFRSLDVSFTTAQPTQGGFSVLHVGGKDFRGQGALGVAPLDIDNFSGRDVGFAFSKELNPSRPVVQNMEVLINASAHEIAHTLGAEHITTDLGIMNPVVDMQNNTFQTGKKPLSRGGGEQDSFDVLRTNIGVAGNGNDSIPPTLTELAVYRQKNVAQLTIYTQQNVAASEGLNLGHYEYTWFLPKGSDKGSSIRIPVSDLPPSIKIIAKTPGGVKKEFNLSVP